MSDKLNTVVVDRNVMVPMRDHVSLGTDIYRPDLEGKFPAIVHRTPYDKSGHGLFWRDAPQVCESFAQHGYVAVIQDIRGWYKSGGEKDSKDETEDGYDTIEWVASQDWCSGKIGLWGYSYPCITALAAAATNPPHLTAMFIGGVPSAGPDADNPSLGATGNPTAIFELGRRILWLLGQGVENRNRGNGTLIGSLTIENAERAFLDIDRYKYLWYVPLSSIPDELFGGLGWKWKQQIKGKYTGICYAGGETKGGDPHKIAVPTYWVTHWYDRLNGDLYLYTETAKNGLTDHARKNQKLMVGPWSHEQPWRSGTRSGDMDFGPESVLGSAWEVMGPWFDHWLKGIDTGIMQKPPVKLFVLGENKWRYEHSWPIREANSVDYFLHSSGEANTAYGTGILNTEPPRDECPDTFVYDSKDPAMSIDLKEEQEASFDLRPNDHRMDILCYRSEPLTADLKVVNQPTIRFWASSSAKDTDFIVRLCDIHPDGFVQWVSYGIVRASRLVGGRSYVNSKPIEPGTIYEYAFPMRVMCTVFKVGHALRIDISSSHFPKFDRNHNTGNLKYWEDPELHTANQTVYHDHRYPSKITLQVVPV